MKHCTLHIDTDYSVRNVSIVVLDGIICLYVNYD